MYGFLTTRVRRMALKLFSRSTWTIEGNRMQRWLWA